MLNQSLRWNFLANIVGRAWQGAISLVSIPVFVSLLGIEAFGIVSLIQTLHALLAILDLGLSATATREVAILRNPRDHESAADVLRTFEWVYWTVAFIVGIVIAGAANWVANSWVAKQTLTPTEVQMAVILGGITVAARWPVSLYTGVLRGLERQVLQNGILVAAVATRVVLTTAALVLISPTIYCLLVTQAVVNVMEALTTGYIARQLVDPNRAARFNFAVLRRVWRFALSFNLVGTFGVLVSAADKLLITKLLPLTALTHYSVCATATGSLQLIYQAAAISLFPRMSSHWHHRDLQQMKLQNVRRRQ